MSGLLRGVAPSILAADFGHLADRVREVLDAGATVVHVDVMDGHFVPPISMGPLVVDALAGLVHDAGALVDVHLMVERPERHLEGFARAGADNITVHVEATPHVHYAVQQVRALGCTAGVALCPSTPIGAVTEVLGDVDLVLAMTVNPGWGGQPFIESSLDKIARLRDLIGPDLALQVDGGVDSSTAGRCAAAGATVFVAGSAVFGPPDPAAAVRAIAAAVSAVALDR